MNKITQSGIADPASIIVIACLLVGVIFMMGSDEIDSPVEEVVEAVLETQGVDIDFSAEKKKNITIEHELPELF